MKKIILSILILFSTPIYAQEKALKIHKDILNSATRSLLIFSDEKGDILNLKILNKPNFKEHYIVHMDIPASGQTNTFTIFNEYYFEEANKELKTFKASSYINLENGSFISNTEDFHHERLKVAKTQEVKLILDNVEHLNDLFIGGNSLEFEYEIDSNKNQLRLEFEDYFHNNLFLKLWANQEEKPKYLVIPKNELPKNQKYDWNQLSNQMQLVPLKQPDPGEWDLRVFADLDTISDTKVFMAFKQRKDSFLIQIPLNDAFSGYGFYFSRGERNLDSMSMEMYYYKLNPDTGEAFPFEGVISNYYCDFIRPGKFKLTLGKSKTTSIRGTHEVEDSFNIGFSVQTIKKYNEAIDGSYSRQSTWNVKGKIENEVIIQFPKLSKKHTKFNKEIKKLISQKPNYCRLQSGTDKAYRQRTISYLR